LLHHVTVLRHHSVTFNLTISDHHTVTQSDAFDDVISGVKQVCKMQIRLKKIYQIRDGQPYLNGCDN